MRSVTKRELNQQTAGVLAEVVDGTSVLVTERGIPRWRIDAVGVDVSSVDRLIAGGRIAPPKDNPAPWPRPRRSSRTPDDVDRLLAESRGDR